MKKRLLALLLTVCMVAALLPSMALAADTSPFQDVKPEDWFYKPVQYVYENRLMTGTGADTFGPNTPTQRGMVAFILYKIEGSPSVNGTAGFSDVKSTDYFAAAVTWAVQNKIVAGMGNNRFVPNGPVTREQLALMLYNYAKYKGYDITSSVDLTRFSDYGKIHSWGWEPLSWAHAIGLINGVGNNRIAPTGNAVRSQMAAILYAFCQKVIEDPGDPDTPTPSPAPSGKATVRFDYNYTGAPAGQVLTVEIGQRAESVTPPTREGYTFLGWYTAPSGGTLFSFDTAINVDTTLYAHWSGAQTVQVAFELGYENSGTIPPVNVVSGQLCPAPGFTPQRENYQFDGWFTSPDDQGVKFDFATIPVTASMTLYAHWTYIGPNWALPYQTNGAISKYDGSDPVNNKFQMMGLTYTQGLTLSSSWNDESNFSFDLGGQYEVMTFKLGHLDNGRQSTETLYFYFDGGSTPSVTIELTGFMSTERVVLNVKNHTNLLIVRKGGGGYDYGMADILMLTAAEAQSQDIVTPADYSSELVQETSLSSGKVMPYQKSNSIDLYDGSDPLDGITMMGILYNQGAWLGSSWNDESEMLFNLGSGFDMISFKIGHKDGGRRSEENIYVWVDDKMVDTINFTGTMSTSTYSLNVQGVNKLRLVRQGGGGYDYGLSDITVYTASDLASAGISVPSLSDYTEVNQTNLATGKVLPYQVGGAIDLYDGTDPVNKTFKMANTVFTFGVTLGSSWNDVSNMNFNLGKGFTTMTFTVGHIDDGRTTAETLYVYKDGDVTPAETIQLTGTMMNTPISLDVSGVNNLRIERQGGGGYDYGIADITVS